MTGSPNTGFFFWFQEESDIPYSNSNISLDLAVLYFLGESELESFKSPDGLIICSVLFYLPFQESLHLNQLSFGWQKINVNWAKRGKFSNSQPDDTKEKTGKAFPSSKGESRNCTALLFVVCFPLWLLEQPVNVTTLLFFILVFLFLLFPGQVHPHLLLFLSLLLFFVVDVFW